MAAILTAEDVVRRIAAECAYVDERGGVGIRLEPAAAIVRQFDWLPPDLAPLIAYENVRRIYRLAAVGR